MHGATLCSVAIALWAYYGLWQVEQHPCVGFCCCPIKGCLARMAGRSTIWANLGKLISPGFFRSWGDSLRRGEVGWLRAETKFQIFWAAPLKMQSCSPVVQEDRFPWFLTQIALSLFSAISHYLWVIWCMRKPYSLCQAPRYCCDMNNFFYKTNFNHGIGILFFTFSVTHEELKC